MDLPHTIEIPVFPLLEQRDIDCHSHQITLDAKHIEYVLDIDADQPPRNEEGYSDPKLPWERKRTFNYCVLLKTAIKGVALSYLQRSNLWKVAIIAEEDHKFFFKVHTKAQIFTDTLKEYLLL